MSKVRSTVAEILDTWIETRRGEEGGGGGLRWAYAKARTSRWREEQS